MLVPQLSRQFSTWASWVCSLGFCLLVVGCGDDAGESAADVPAPVKRSTATAPPAPGALPPSIPPDNTSSPTEPVASATEEAANTEETDPSTEATGAPDQYVGEGLSRSLVEWSSKATEHLSGARQREEDGSVTSQFSWMVEILPFVGHQQIYDEIAFDEAWTKRVNIKAAIQVIPTFQNPLDDRRRWEGFPYDGLALSHFAGISGVERRRLDVAANYPRDHPDAGIFGYDQIMRADEVTDGTSRTLAMIGSGELAGPWIQAGGATVRGARQPYFDEITGFSSRGLADRSGAVALTADGAAHFVSSDIDPQVFEALCTAHGNEDVSGLEAQLQSPEPVPADKRQTYRPTTLAE